MAASADDIALFGGTPDEQKDGASADDLALFSAGPAETSKPAPIDMGPAARRARAGMAPGERETTAEQAGTYAGPITTDSPLAPGVHRGPVRVRQPMEAAARPEDVVRVQRRPNGSTRVLAGPETQEMADPLVQMGTATALGMASGGLAEAPLAAAGGAAARLAPVVGAGVEGGTANVAAGGDFDTGAALGLVPFAPRAARAGARATREAAGTVAAKLAPNPEKAIKNAKGWVAKDIAGEIKGASTSTARKQLADDADHVSTLVLRDRPLDTAINKARDGRLDDIEKARGIVQERLKAVESDRLAKHWDAADQALPAGGVRSGDLDSFLASRSGALRDTGIPSHIAEADALEGIRKDIRNAKEWGGGKQYDPTRKVQGGALDGMQTGDAIALLERQKTGPTAAVLGEEVKRLRADATVEGFNPDTVVPARQIQRLWSDVAGNAYKSFGGINGTAAFERKLDIASHLREFRDRVVDAVADANPRAAADLRSANRDYSALKRVEKVLEQRVNHAKANAQGASVSPKLAKAAKEIKHSPHGFVLAKIPEAYIAGKRAFDRWVARRALTAQQQTAVRNIFTSKGAPGRGVPQAVAAGVPASIAMWAARAAAGGARLEQAPSHQFAGQVEAGNVDLTNRPRVKNADGSISTIRSMSFQDEPGGPEILVPTVSEDGRIMTDDEAIDQYHRTGRHLGKFKTVEAADAAAQALHEEQARMGDKWGRPLADNS